MTDSKKTTEPRAAEQVPDPLEKSPVGLVQIQNSPPPFHQSTQVQTACPKFYVASVIQGRRKPGSLEAARGTQVHGVMARYASWCAVKGVAMDLDAFDQFAAGVGPMASRILTGMRESYKVDYLHLLATEVPMALDEHFNPTNLADVLDQTVADSELPVCYQGTLDALYIFRDERKILIDDAKTHINAFDPKLPEHALQGQMYSLFAFHHFPWVNEVTFRLWFVRYKNLTRQVTYSREDLPSLTEIVRAARNTQLSIHSSFDEGRDIEAIGNSNCFYCPLLSDRECPILQDNPNAQGRPSEWLSSALVYSAYAKVNNARMKAWVEAKGTPIILRDFNSKAYTYGPVEKESEVYPVFDVRDGEIQHRVVSGVPMPILPVIDLLDSYADDNPGDSLWMRNLVISSTSLKKYLKTNKRSFLDQAVEDVCDRVTKVQLRVSKPLDVVPSEEDDEQEDWEENEF